MQNIEKYIMMIKTAERSLGDKNVGLSNILDGELVRRGPVKRSHREVVRAAVMDSELLGEVIEGVETVTGVKALLVLPVASLDLAVVARCVGTDELVADL